MKLHPNLVCLALIVLTNAGGSTVLAENAKPESQIKDAYKEWRLISVSQRTDNNSLRAILGNNKAMRSLARKSPTKWVDGAILAKVVWQQTQHPKWPAANIPGAFSKAEAMIKDRKRFHETGGWGFAHWVNGDLVMHDEKTSAMCFACHTAVEDTDYVFTRGSL